MEDDTYKRVETLVRTHLRVLELSGCRTAKTVRDEKTPRRGAGWR